MEKKQEWLVEFGLRLRAEREKQGLTQQSLATKALTRPDYIAQIERAARNQTLKTLMNILAALDVSADYLIYGTGQVEQGASGSTMNEFVSFLTRRSEKQISSYYEIVRFLSSYVEQ